MKFTIVLLFSVALQIKAKLEENWWQRTNIYDISVWLYKDSNGDGIGDFVGLISKLDYLQDLGINVIKLFPIFPSPESINEHYATDDFKNVHSKLGSLDDFDALIIEARARDIKILLDINFNHCHRTHEWFRKSVEGIEPYKNYFIWKDPIYRNNVVKDLPTVQKIGQRSSKVSVWNWIEKRKQFYYASNGIFTPNLNLKNKALRAELNKIMQFWFDKGVSGFNVMHKSAYLDEETVTQIGKKMNPNHQNFYDFVREMREFTDIYNNGDIGYQRIIIIKGASSYTTTEALKLFGNRDFPLVHSTSCSILQYWMEFYPAEEMKKRISLFTDLTEDAGIIFEWILYEIYESRPKEKDWSYYSNIAFTITAILPGIWHLAYGSELGMTSYGMNSKFHIGDKFRFNVGNSLPMQWDDSKNAGFSESDHPILFPNPNYWYINVEKLKNEKINFYHFSKDLLKLRKKNTFKYGDLHYLIVTKWVLAIVRTYKEHETFITLVNLANFVESVNLTNAWDKLPHLCVQLEVVAATPSSFYNKGDKVNISHFGMRPFSAMILMLEKLKS